MMVKDLLKNSFPFLGFGVLEIDKKIKVSVWHIERKNRMELQNVGEFSCTL